MGKSIEEYKNEIVNRLKENQTYSPGLDIQITGLASAIRNLELANAEIDTLEVTTVNEVTRYGSKLAPHPVFKIAKDAQDMITRQMKALGLTAESLGGREDNDPLIELTKTVRDAAEKGGTITRRSK